MIPSGGVPDPLHSYLRSFELDSASQWNGTRDMHFGDFKSQLRLLRDQLPSTFNDV